MEVTKAQLVRSAADVFHDLYPGVPVPVPVLQDLVDHAHARLTRTRLHAHEAMQALVTSLTSESQAKSETLEGDELPTQERTTLQRETMGINALIGALNILSSDTNQAQPSPHSIP